MAPRLAVFGVIAVYLLIVSLSILFGKILIAIAFTLMSLDRLVLSRSKLKNDSGIEIIALPAAMFGVELGPIVGFFFTLIVFPLLSVSSWVLALPQSSSSPPLNVDLDLLIFPLVALVAGYFSGTFSSFIAVIIAVGLREALIFIKGIIMGDYTFVVLRGLNVFLDIILLYGVSSLLA